MTHIGEVIAPADGLEEVFFVVKNHALNAFVIKV